MLSPEEGLMNLRESAWKKGAYLLSRNWAGAGNTIYRFRCRNRFHPDYEKTYAKAVNAGQGCTYCSRNRPASLDEANHILRERGLRADGPLSFTGERIDATCIECGRHHRGHFSELCKRECSHRRKFAEPLSARVDKAVREFGGTIIAADRANADSRWQFRCSAGHEFSRTAISVLPTKNQPGKFCNRCSGGPEPVNAERVMSLIVPKGGKLLSDEAEFSSKSLFLIQCNLGHIFQKQWGHLSNGQWCPICSKGSKSEEIARTVFETLFGKEFKKVRPKWLRYPKTSRLLELDGYNDELKIAFEYQGAQHRNWQIGNEGKSGLNDRIERDKWKRKRVAEEGITLVELWDTTAYEDFGAEINKQLSEAGRDFPEIDFKREVDFNSAFIRDNRLEELRQRARTRNISLLSEKWISVHSKYQFKCNVCGNVWDREAAGYLYERIAGCEKCGYRIGASKKKKGISALHLIASQHKGTLLSEEYKTIRDKYWWRCEKGHEFEKSAHLIESRGKFCTQCGTSDIDDLKKHAQKHNGELVSETFTKLNDIYHWSCHIHGPFQRRFREMVRDGGDKFCMECDKIKAGLGALEELAGKRNGKSLNTSWYGRKKGHYSFVCTHGKQFTLSGYSLFYRNRWCGCDDGTAKN